MKKIEFTDEATFETEEIEFTDEHYEVAEQLYEKFCNHKSIPIIVRNDRKSLCFFIDKSKNNTEREMKTNIFRITIENLE